KKMDVLEIDAGTDYRLGRVESKDVYFVPLGDASTAALKAAFAGLVDGETPGPEEIPVLGRKLKVPYAADRVAMMTFAELCEQPLGPADYVALASNFRALIVD